MAFQEEEEIPSLEHKVRIPIRPRETRVEHQICWEDVRFNEPCDNCPSKKRRLYVLSQHGSKNKTLCSSQEPLPALTEVNTMKPHPSRTLPATRTKTDKKWQTKKSKEMPAGFQDGYLKLNADGASPPAPLEEKKGNAEEMHHVVFGVTCPCRRVYSWDYMFN